MAIIRTESRKPIAFYDGPTYAPEAMNTWVAVDERDYPWNTIGHALATSAGKGKKVDHVMSAAEVLDATGLDMNVRKLPVVAQDGGVTHDLPRMFVTGIDTPDGFHPFGAVSDKYEVVQPRDALGFFDQVIEAREGSHYSAAWLMREKSLMGVTIELPDEVVVDPDGANDRTGLHILGSNSFDGSTGLAGAMVTTRYFCMNQVAPALKHAKRSFSFRHTRNVHDRSLEAAQLLGIAWNYAKELDALANGLYRQTMSDGAFEMFLESLKPFQVDEETTKDAVRNRVMRRREEAKASWEAPHNANIRGTKWGALNVVAEFAEWGRTVDGSPRTGTSPERQRAIGTLVSPHVSGLVTRATEVLVGA